MATISVRKILQLLYYIQNNAPKTNLDRFGTMYLLKMLYFTDRYHLRSFGITASDDHYVAMIRGPVASNTLDILKKKIPVPLSKDVVDLSEYDVEITNQLDDELSKSCKDALDFALLNFGNYNRFDISEITHAYPEWFKHQKSIYIDKNKSVTMDLKDFFSNPTENSSMYLMKHSIQKDPYAEDDEVLKLMREDFETSF